MSKNEQRISQLSRLIKSDPNRIVPFVGAGCSMPFGGKSWAQFLTGLVEVAQADGRFADAESERINALISAGRLLEAADKLIGSFGGKESAALGTAIRGLCANSLDVDDSILHRLHLLQSSLIVTTNFDTVIEDVWYRVRNARRLRVTTELSLHVLNAPADLSWLVKIHGDQDTPSSIVLGQSDYDGLMRRPYHAQLFESLVATRTLLFIGYGVSDFDLGLTLENLRAPDRTPTARERRMIALSLRAHLSVPPHRRPQVWA